MTIEFEAILKDGRIEIPAELAGKLSGAVHVVLTASAPTDEEPSMIDELLDNPVQIDGFVPMTRDEANAR